MDFRLPIDMDDVRLLAQNVKLGDLLSTHLADRLGRRHPPQDSCVVPLNGTRKAILDWRSENLFGGSVEGL